MHFILSRIQKFSEKFFKKRWSFVLTAFVLFSLGILFPRAVYAEGTVDSALNWITNKFVGLLLYGVRGGGRILLAFIDILIKLGSYNGFLETNAVIVGWQVMRDVCNIGFIIGLLIIAFGTTLKIQSYHYKNTLLKLLIMAILINFSKTISGLFIDFSQVIMVTFFNAIETAARGNFTIGFGIENLLNFRNTVPGGADTIDNSSVLISTFMALGMVIIASIIVFIMVMMLLFRVVMLWVLVILSPLAYVSSAIPSMKQYGDRWWQTFSKYLVNGPIMAFFLWLSLSLVALNYQDTLQYQSQQQQSGGAAATGAAASTPPTTSIIKTPGLSAGATSSSPNQPAPTFAVAASKASTTQGIYDYITMVALLVMTLSLASQSGVMGADMAGTALNKVRNFGSKLATLPVRATKGAIGYGAEVATGLTGVNLLPSQWAEAWKHNRQRVRGNRIKKAISRANARGGFWGAFGDSEAMFEEYANAKNIVLSPRKLAKSILTVDKVKSKKLRRELQGYQTELSGQDEKKIQLDNQYKPQIEQAKIEAKSAKDAVQNTLKERDEATQSSQILEQVVHSGSIDLQANPKFEADLKAQIDTMTDAYNLETDPVKEADLQSKIQAMERVSTQMQGLASGQKLDISGDPAFQNIMQQELTRRDQKLRTLQSDAALATQKSTEKEASFAKIDGEYKTKDEAITKEKEKIKKIIGEKQHELVETKPPEFFGARSAVKSLVDEEYKKIEHIQEADELVALAKEAKDAGERYRFMAILTKLTKDGNENEFLRGFTNPETGKQYRTDSIQGMHDFFKNELMSSKTGLGMDKKSALSFEQDLNYMAEDTNHWTMARGVGYKNGELVQLGEDEQSDAAVTQMGKNDQENLFRKMTRLGVGGEDENNEYQLGMVGAKWLAQSWKKGKQSISDRRNANHDLVKNLGLDRVQAKIAKIAKVAVLPGDMDEFKYLILGKDSELVQLGRDSAEESKQALNRDVAEILKKEVEHA